jgi:hypothetical protein
LVNRPRTLRLVLAGGLVALVLAGCRIPENALDGPLAVPLRITTNEDTIDVDAPTWYADSTAIFVCPTEPPALPEPGPQRDGWTPGGGCHDFGRVRSPDGLATTLALETLSDEALRPFLTAGDWFLLLVAVEGDRATAAIHSSFPSPIRPAN